jgi:hypothetical protein
MKVLKVYNDAHQEVKVEAAKSGRTTVEVASLLLRHAIWMVRSGQLDLGKMDEAEKRRSKKKAKA